MSEIAEKALSLIIPQGTKSLFDNLNDRVKIIELLMGLKRRGISFDSYSVEGWAKRNGWDKRSCEKLKEIVEGVLVGRKFRTHRAKVIKDSGEWDKLIDFAMEKD